MTQDEIRESWNRGRDDYSARAIEEKRSQDTLLFLAARYRSLSLEERPIIDALLNEELASPVESVRFGAIAVIREFRIVSALQGLRYLADRLESDNSPGAYYERLKVMLLAGELATSTPSH
jgi:hypothetical protein